MTEDVGIERKGFTGELWRSIEDLYTEILSHSFLRGLTDGTLPGESFRFYVLQDAIYLREYARALSLAGVRSPDENALVMFNEHSAGAISVERSLHEGFLKDLGITQEEAEATEASPTTLAYTSFLMRTAALGDYPEVLGAVLPCYWIYERVGKALLEHGSPNPRYQKWIETYGGEEFGALVEAVLDLTDRVCEGLNSSQAARVRKAFVTTSRYEWMFWDAAWRQEEWPV
ncbi:MAG: Thiaminase II involved in salvage of thiamin pyrimidine moiety, TenA subgroup with Cys in active site [uncultured Rubrobacteraceae bacterium]|uniref:Aminopyrimidine aminohydrolase n=1 Tax=uncultured Rubrobacteraceae bacterium TaxID=349277 RepID=A0A6J4Q911_9ACTN|nr:MAG: Thiaminase II involved in salvage of thiamin pyrimidine moiety, TenA subgroup with Cys in active site [uncultured Rubrobacteraceae bacterium]